MSFSYSSWLISIRALVVGLAIVAGLAAGSDVQAAPAEAKTKSPPNVVLIIADDQAWTDYSFMGHPHIRTPNIDRLASEGLAFRRGYVTNSLCRPSLMAILTGLYPHQHRVTSNDPPLPPGGARRNAEKDPAFLANRQRMIANVDRVPTLPRMLAKQGYESFQTGKWWEGDYKRGGFTDGMSVGGRHGDKGLAIGRDTMQPMYDFVRRTKAAGKPFFLWYAPMLPHSPHNPPQAYLMKYESIAPTLEIAKYWAMCEWFDETCGQLLAFIKEEGLDDNTLIVFLADNGWIQDPNGKNYAPKSKQSPYDGGLRTPIILKMPGRVQPQVSERLAQSIDLAPTILALVGLEPTKEMNGINLLDPKAVDARHTIYGECFDHNAVDIDRPASSLKWRWCVDGYQKLIVPHAPNVVGSPELYDLKKDPHETADLAKEQPQEVERLQKKLDAWWPGT